MEGKPKLLLVGMATLQYCCGMVLWGSEETKVGVARMTKETMSRLEPIHI